MKKLFLTFFAGNTRLPAKANYKTALSLQNYLCIMLMCLMAVGFMSCGDDDESDSSYESLIVGSWYSDDEEDCGFIFTKNGSYTEYHEGGKYEYSGDYYISGETLVMIEDGDDEPWVCTITKLTSTKLIFEWEEDDGTDGVELTRISDDEDEDDNNSDTDNDNDDANDDDDDDDNSSNNSSSSGEKPDISIDGGTTVYTTSIKVKYRIWNSDDCKVTSAKIHYGTTRSCSKSKTASISSSMIQATISGLEKNTTYYFKCSATSSAGTTTSSVSSLTTNP